MGFINNKNRSVGSVFLAAYVTSEVSEKHEDRDTAERLFDEKIEVMERVRRYSEDGFVLDFLEMITDELSARKEAIIKEMVTEAALFRKNNG